MPRLILINGAPASGKSALAERYAGAHPLSLVLDIDRVRGMLGDALRDPTAAGLAARRLSLAMAREHLQAGHDVVVPQFLGRAQFVAQLAALCAELSVPFLEVALAADPAVLAERFAARTRIAHDDGSPRTAHERDAARLLDRAGGPEALVAMTDQVRGVSAGRPATRWIPAGTPEATYAALLALIEQHHSP